MPKERLTPLETREILTKEKVRVIDTMVEKAHSEIIYEILTGESSKLKCDSCGSGAKYIHHTRDHFGQNFVVLTCSSCAPKGYEKLSQQRF